MITFSKIKSAAIESGQRILKVLQFGVKTADEIAPFGDDASPLEGMTAIYAPTSEAGEPVIIGYINTNQVAKPGEKRIYSLDSGGGISFYIYLKSDGTMEFGGTADNLVRFTPLNAGLQSEVVLLNAELVKIQAVLTTLGGTYVHVPVTVDVSAAKINEAKCL